MLDVTSIFREIDPKTQTPPPKAGYSTFVLLAVGIVLALYLLIVLAIAWFSLHPLRTPIFVSPGLLGSPQETISLQGEAGALTAWWVQAEEQKAVVVYVHGYLMNRAELAPVTFQLWKMGASGLLLDLRAHGRSGGKKCTLGYMERNDVKVALRYAREKAAGAPVIVIGSSMGSAASALALADEPGLADILVMDSGFSRLSSAVLGWWRFVGGKVLMYALAPCVVVAAPLVGYSPFKIDIAKSIASIGPKPILHLHGTRDLLALPSEAQRNFEASVGPTDIVWFEGHGHSEYRWEQPVKYMEVLVKFLRAHGGL